MSTSGYRTMVYPDNFTQLDAAEAYMVNNGCECLDVIVTVINSRCVLPFMSTT